MNTLKGKNSKITVLENSIKIEPSGWRGWDRVGVEVPFDKIKGVEFLEPTWGLFGFLTIIINEGSNLNINIFTSRTQLMNNPYSIPFDKKQLKEFEEMRNKINTIISSKPFNSSQSSSPDILEQIEKLSKLKDSGILTEEEFNTKKEELLKKL